MKALRKHKPLLILSLSIFIVFFLVSVISSRINNTQQGSCGYIAGEDKEYRMHCLINKQEPSGSDSRDGDSAEKQSYDKSKAALKKLNVQKTLKLAYSFFTDNESLFSDHLFFRAPFLIHDPASPQSSISYFSGLSPPSL